MIYFSHLFYFRHVQPYLPRLVQDIVAHPDEPKSFDTQQSTTCSLSLPLQVAVSVYAIRFSTSPPLDCLKSMWLSALTSAKRISSSRKMLLYLDTGSGQKTIQPVILDEYKIHQRRNFLILGATSLCPPFTQILTDTSRNDTHKDPPSASS
ncbi:hypothetical protein ALC56_02832 [Trachymyrmex septentrionalis]|uniref:Uncharacterized protein n=1 Tax=Trachymyrmex septentrionalis TaxID=34720 RepID=A0A195FRV9_9HYME|nr:hypothetical protein ALC56_02832 [Trachymyrmex septentrionalis]